MERRSQVRISSEQSATLFLEDGAQFPCTIADFCEQGMFVTFNKGALKRTERPRILRISFRGDANRELFVNAEPMHLTDNAAGIRFVNHYPDVIRFLKDRYAKSDDQKISSEHARLIAVCVDFTASFMKERLTEILPLIIDDCRKEAIASSSDQLANTRMNIAEKLEKSAEGISSLIVNEILRVESLAPPVNVSANDSSDLSLVDKGEFEDWLLSRVLITKLESAYRSELLLLKMRTDEMQYFSAVRSSCPLGPERIVYAFRTAIHSRIQDVALERQAFKILEKDAISHLETLYGKLNQILEEGEVLVDLNLGKISKNPEREVPNVGADNQKAAADSNIQDDSVEDSPKMQGDQKPIGRSNGVESSASKSAPYAGGELNHRGIESGNISSLDLSQQSDEVGLSNDSHRTYESVPSRSNFKRVGQILRKAKVDVTKPDAEPAHYYDRGEFEKNLYQITNDARNDRLSEEPRSLLDRVMTSMASKGMEVKGLQEEQKERIDVVDRFFGSLQVNPRLSDKGKQHLYQLEMPVLRQLLENEEFFDSEDSPLKDVLNRIAALGAKGGRLGRVGHQKVEQLIERINQEYDSNRNVVDEVKAELDDLLGKQHALYLKNVERVAAAADGAHKVEEARRLVATMINQRTQGKEVPQAVDSLLNQGWVEHMKFLAIKEGIESHHFKDSLGVIDRLIAFSEDPSVGFDAKRFVPLIQDGLKTVSGGQEAPSIVREELKQLILDAPIGKQKTVKIDALAIDEEGAEREKVNLQRSKELRPWIRRAKSISLNAWLRFDKNESREPQFMRLVWIAKGYTKFVFVNHQGMKVIELGLFKFAGYLKGAQITPDPDFNAPIVKQGLDDMVKDVYNKLAFDSTHDSESGFLNEREFAREVSTLMKSGERTQACCLMYVRILSGSLDEKSESLVKDSLIKTFEMLLVKDVLVARINRYDFTVFLSGVAVDSVAKEVLSAVDDCYTNQIRPIVDVKVLRSEVWGYLGFHNYGALIETARDSLSDVPVMGEGDDAPFGNIKVRLDEHDSSLVAGEASFNATDESVFDVYSQTVRKLSERFVAPAHSSLVCVKRDKANDATYVPESVEDLRELDLWWLGFLARFDPRGDKIEDLCRVPISALSLQDDEFKEKVFTLIECGSFSDRQVCFDIYSAGMFTNPHQAADIIRDLQGRGFLFSLADFATKDCPAHLIQSLPVDMVIVAGQVIQPYTRSQNENGVNDDMADDGKAKSLVEIAHHFGKAVVANNIDSAIVLQKVEREGADYAQGDTISTFEKL